MGNPAPPDAERDMCISLRGSPDTEFALECDTRHMPQGAGGLVVRPRPPDSSMPNRAFRPWLGATPHFRCPVRASGRVGTYTPVPPSLGGRSRTRDPLREGHQRVGVTGAATSVSEPERPMGTADPPRHGDRGECVGQPGDSL